MFDKLEAVERRYEEIGTRMTDPTVIGDSSLLMSLMKEHREIEPIVYKYREYKKAKSDFDGAKEMLEMGGLDKELKELAEEEMLSAKADIETFSEELKILNS